MVSPLNTLYQNAWSQSVHGEYIKPFSRRSCPTCSQNSDAKTPLIPSSGYNWPVLCRDTGKVNTGKVKRGVSDWPDEKLIMRREVHAKL